jgi:ABC-2 type transport system permease protein
VADTLHAPASRGPDANAATEFTLPAAREGDHSAASVVAGQVLRGLWQVLRTPIAAFFTVVLPLAFLLLIGSITGNAVIDPTTGTRVAQFTTLGLLAVAVAMAVFSNPAIAIVIAREAGVLKRLRGTTLPAWAFLVGTLLASTAFALAASALMVGVAMVVFDVSLPAASLPAEIVTLVFGIATFAALGFALAALAPSVGAAQGVANGTVILLAFVSEIFLVAAEVPRWLSLIGDIFPLKHLVNGLQDAFDPYLVGSAWGGEHLAVMAAWALVGAVVAVRRFRWEPRGGSGTTAAPHDAAVQGAAQHLPIAHHPASAGVVAIDARAHEVVLPGPVTGHPTRATMLLAQVATATRAARRDPWSLVFAVAMPTLLVLLLPAVFGSGEMPWLDDMRFPQFYAPAMAVYGIVIHAFVNVPEGLAAARERGVLKRLGAHRCRRRCSSAADSVASFWSGSASAC